MLQKVEGWEYTEQRDSGNSYSVLENAQSEKIYFVTCGAADCYYTNRYYTRSISAIQQQEDLGNPATNAQTKLVDYKNDIFFELYKRIREAINVGVYSLVVAFVFADNDCVACPIGLDNTTIQ
jgi:hypothetical protein